MKINGLIAGLILTVLVPKGNYAQGKKEQDTLIYFREDSLLTEDLLRRFSDCREEPVASLLVEIGRSLVGTPYVSHTLENGIEEKLVVNLRELDCTTFAENCLALARTIRSGETQFGYFVRELQHIRYRDGLRQGYLSRLHYFSEWIGNNVQKGLIAEPAACFGSTLDVQVGFMYAHSGNYSVLSSNPELVPLLVKQEKII
ncbi:MAG: N-acetylmuramoyl-L-alanine amidase-like domain-containing protein, partial [Mangrovibacterium sp.]